MELAAVIQVGETAEERHIAVGKAAGDAQLEGFDVLSKLAQDIVIVQVRIEVIEAAQSRQGECHEQGGAAQPALARDVAPGGDAHALQGELAAQLRAEGIQAVDRAFQQVELAVVGQGQGSRAEI